MLFFILLSLYIKNINIYKPFAIEIQGINQKQKNEINFYAISPLNKEFKIRYDQSIQAWLQYYGYFKQVNLAINSSLIPEIDTLLLTSQNKLKKLCFSDLKIISKKNNLIIYEIPYEFFGERIFSKLLFSIIYHNKSQLLFKIILILFGLLILFYILLKLIKNKFSFKKLPFLIKSFLISAVIVVCLFFSVLYIKYSLTTFITALLFICFAGLFVHLLLFLAHKTFKFQDISYYKIKKSINIILTVWLFLETILRITGINRSYNERTGAYYVSGFISDMAVDKNNPRLHIHPQHKLLIVQRDEFNYPFKHNADGLRDKTRAVEKDSNEYRIICLGNSYTEGIGAPQDSTWPALLENYLKNETKNKVCVLNAGVTSADPFLSICCSKRKS